MNPALARSLNPSHLSKKLNHSRGLFFGFLIVGALLAFELFNYTTTDYALNDFLGGLRFIGIRWATILAIAFCAIDFAGIARLFTPEKGESGPKEVWYLLGAWLLAASMNAMLTWWGVSLAVLNHQSLGGTVIPRETMLEVVPIFVAIMVWLIRVLIIGTFSIAGNRLFTQADTAYKTESIPVMHRSEASHHPLPSQALPIRPASKPASVASPRPEPTYHPAGMTSYDNSNNQPRQ